MKTVEEAIARAKPGVFTVTQFLADGTVLKLCENAAVETAVKIFLHFTSNVGAELGTTRRVTISDDCKSLVREWRNPR